MYVLDFEYDGKRLSDFGYIVCGFGDTSGVENISVGSQISFNKTPMHGGRRHSLTSTKYDQCISATIEICKNPDRFDDAMFLTDRDVRMLARWLNRRDFHKFKAYNPWDIAEWKCYYNASFNVEKVIYGENVYGLRLTMETDSPFGYMEDITETWTINNTSVEFVDLSDEIGYQYPNLTITCLAAGNLSLNNDRMEGPMIISNCSSGEVITINGNAQIISSSVSEHQIYNDFNYNFFKIVNSLDDRINTITSTLPITLELTYAPIVKNTP